MRKVLFMAMAVMLSASVLTGCGQQAGGGKGKFNSGKDIHVVSREDGSGTRGAFIELLKIENKTPDGKKKDLTTKEAIIANKTDVMMANIAGDAYAIGYISLGSLNTSVKALDIDGVKASSDNIKNKSYKVARPFNIATKGATQGRTKDFTNFIMSKEGQEIISKNYISVDANAKPYKSAGLKGKIVIAGSSSVTPVMEKLAEAYQKINKGIVIEIQMSDSTAGMKGVIDGTCDIGMASRELKASEKNLLDYQAIAFDGIAVIVNKDNTLQNISAENVRKIYTGESKKWNDVK